MPEYNEARCVLDDYNFPADGATGVSVTIPYVRQHPQVQVWDGSDWVNASITNYQNIVLNATPPIEGVSRYAGNGYVQHDITGSLYGNTTYTFCFTLNITFSRGYVSRTETFTTPTISFTTGDGPPPPPPSTPTLSSPSDGETGIYLNTDWLLQLEWDDEDAEDISLYTVWFHDPHISDPAVGWMEQTDRSRYSTVGYFMRLGYTLNYNTTYSWFVRKTIDGVDYDSPIWTFTTEDSRGGMAAGKMVELTAASGDIDTTDQLAMFEAWQRAFIINGEKLKIADFGTIKLSHSALSKPHAKGDLLTQNQGNGNYAYMVVDYTNPDKTETYGYAYYASEAEAFDTSHSVSGSGEGSSFTPTAVTNPPHWYDYTAAKGELPPKAYLGCLYNGRIVLAGNPAEPTQFYMSRQGDAFDYQYMSNDPGTPVKGGQGDIGKLGDIIRALAPYKDEYLILGCASTMWVLFGDPAAGGAIRELSLTTGIFGSGAFCWDDTNHFYWWGNGGLYRTAVPGTPVCISRIKLPQLVKDEAASPMTHRILMAYDRDRHGILVTITKLDDGSNSNYWYDLAVLDDHGVGGFYPEVYPKEYSAYSLLYYDSNTPSLRGLLVGGMDGHIRTFDDAAKNDSTGVANHAIESYVCVGPIHMSGSARHEGMLNGLDITCAGGLDGGSQADSGDIAFKVFTSRTAENVLEQMSANDNPVFAGVFKGPGARRGSTRRQTARGEFLGIRLQNTALDETWAFEDMSVNLKASGRVK